MLLQDGNYEQDATFVWVIIFFVSPPSPPCGICRCLERGRDSDENCDFNGWALLSRSYYAMKEL